MLSDAHTYIGRSIIYLSLQVSNIVPHHICYITPNTASRHKCPLSGPPPCALLATNRSFLGLLSELNQGLMEPPAPPPGQVRTTQVGGGEIPVKITLKTSEQSPITGRSRC